MMMMMNGSVDTPMMEAHQESTAELATPAINGDAKDMTSKDYYFDSYAHFGIHEVGDPNWNVDIALIGRFID